MPRRPIAAGAVLVALICQLPTIASASPVYTPASRDTVLLRHAPRPASLPATSRADAPAAAIIARAAIESGRATGDPREFGRAQAALAPWWQVPVPPASLLLLRATLKQQKHDFSGALADLELLLKQAPRDAQAHLTRASIFLATGQPALAKRDCAALIAQASLLTLSTCVAAAGAVNGQAADALASLNRALSRAAEAPIAERLWARTLLAEVAAAQGDKTAAAAAFDTALGEAGAANISDPYLLAAAADFWLDSGAAARVPPLLNDHTANDGLLLRLALAQDALVASGNRTLTPERNASVQALRERQALARARGETFHAREEGRFALYLEHDAPRALALAQQNWASQREPADARLLLEAAAAAGRPAAAEPVKSWMQSTGIEDQHLNAALAALPH